MQGNNIDLIFPPRAIEYLCNIRSERWDNLVNNLLELKPTDPARIAFVLMMVRIGGCTSCQSDSFRAMRGCILCSITTIKRFKGNDQNLIDQYDAAKKDVNRYLKGRTDYDV